MSGIIGIYNLDGRPVDQDLLTRMIGTIASRGPDGTGHWTDGPIGLGHVMLHTTPESLHEKQPLTDENGDLCLVLDGRVDNREELRKALFAKGTRLRTDTDAELVLRSFECWGTECPGKIIGDFAFAIWDRRKRRLFCARDPVGIKPFYYYTNGHIFLFGSEIVPFFEDQTVPKKPNEGMIGEYLAVAITSTEETLYQDIFRLPPAHLLLVHPEGISRSRYWDIDPAREIRYRTDREYADHFREIFKEAVRCRLRSHGPVGAELSGGLDSSSVVGMAQSLYRDGGLATPGFETFSLVFPGLACDESRYIEEVVRLWGLKSNLVCPEVAGATRYAEQVRRYGDFPDYPNGVMTYPIMSLACSKGFRILLTGYGGDEWLTGSFYHYADMLRNFQITSLIRQVRADRQFSWDSGVPSITFPPSPILRLGILPLVPVPVKRALKRVLRRSSIPLWVDPEFARRISLRERLGKNGTELRFSSFSQRDIYLGLRSGLASHCYELMNRFETLFNLERRHPFMDRRLIEFAIALSEEQRWRVDEPKFVLRRAMQGLLPEKVRRRATKADFSHLFPETLQGSESERVFNSLAIESLNWVDGCAVREMYQKMTAYYRSSDFEYISFILKLYMIFGIELWFTTVFGKQQTNIWISAA